MFLLPDSNADHTAATRPHPHGCRAAREHSGHVIVAFWSPQSGACQTTQFDLSASPGDNSAEAAWDATLAVHLQYGRARAKAFNVGESQRQTGVRFADVAGIDAIKAEVKVVMDMLLDAPEYRAIGAKPFRVRAGASVCQSWLRLALTHNCHSLAPGATGDASSEEVWWKHFIIIH